MILYSALSAVGFRPFLRTVLRMDVRGGEHVPATGPAILVANHESIFDPWVLGVITERQIRYLAKAELWRYPVLRSVMNGFGAIPIERGGGDLLALRDGVEILRGGAVLGVFPQGTTRLDRPRRFHRGAARLALETGAPIVPVRLDGTRGILRPGLPAVTVEAFPPIGVERARPTIAAARGLTAELEEALAG
ncbi:MAG: lysophospholipid acyltransferase family protein [Gaiellaceae bacterium]